MTTPQNNTQPLSDCCKAITKLVGGVGDFSDHEEAVTMHYECSMCNQPCDIYVSKEQRELYKNNQKLDSTQPVLYTSEQVSEDKSELEEIIEGSLKQAYWHGELKNRNGCLRPIHSNILAALTLLLEKAKLEARIDAAQELLSYRTYEIGEGAKPIVVLGGGTRKVVDEFDIKMHINTWQAQLTALQGKGERC